MIDSSSIDELIGVDVHGSDGAKIGTVGQVYVDNDTQTPTWVTVRTGLFGTSETFAPLTDATFDGGVVHVAREKSFVKDAPRVEADGALTEEEEQSLYSYYGLSGTAGTPDAAAFSDGDRTSNAHGTEGHDTSGPTTDDAMTRSEERLHVGTERVEAGRARLRKHVVTEQVTRTVPVSHEEVTLSREPITDATADAALSGPELSEEEHEVVLTEERVVTSKETVPVERVRLGTEAVTEQETVNEEVSHEEIELDDADVRTTSTDGPRTDRP